jgi:hypothetical protein
VALPDWFAVTVTCPAPVIVRTEPDTEAGPTTEYVTGMPEVAVAFNVIDPAP